MALPSKVARLQPDSSVSVHLLVFSLCPRCTSFAFYSSKTPMHPLKPSWGCCLLSEPLTLQWFFAWPLTGSASHSNSHLLPRNDSLSPDYGTRVEHVMYHFFTVNFQSSGRRQPVTDLLRHLLNRHPSPCHPITVTVRGRNQVPPMQTLRKWVLGLGAQ